MKYFAIGVLALVLAAGSAMANTTVYDTTYNVSPYFESDLHVGLPTNPSAPLPGGSMSGATDILDTFYSSYTRVDDTMDQIWLDHNGGVWVRAIYTSSYLKLGYALNEGTGSPVVDIDDTINFGVNPTKVDATNEVGNFDIVDNTDGFVWVVTGASTAYSLPALNGGIDRMVTFKIDGIYNHPYFHDQGSYIPTVPTYVLGFEDGSDWDFQDFVVEVQKVSPIPEPLTLLGVFAGISGLGAYLRRRQAA